MIDSVLHTNTNSHQIIQIIRDTIYVDRSPTKEIIPFVGIIAACLAAVFASIGYMLKIRREKLRNKRNTLYFLLEFRHALLHRQLSPKEIFHQYMKCVKEFYKKKGREINEATFNGNSEFAISSLKQMLEAKTSDLSPSALRDFALVLSEVAKDDPVLAWRIKGSEITEKLFKIQNDFLEAFSNINLGPEFNNNAPELAAETIRKRSINDVISNMNSDILSVSRDCGYPTYWKCKSIIKKNSLTNIDFSNLGIDPILEELYKIEIDALNVPAQKLAEQPTDAHSVNQEHKNPKG